MDLETIEQRKKEVVERYGEWTAHNVQLEGDLYTIAKHSTANLARIHRDVQIITDVAGSFEDLRILDLGALEGGFAVEFAMRGAQVVAIEGRERNIQKARFVKDVLGLDDKLEFVQDDVRNLSVARYGKFDVILCAGLLYHLDAPDVFRLVEAMAEACRRFLIVDTHFSVTAEESRTYKGREYFGWTYTEYPHEPTPEEKEKFLWAALDNQKSFWLTHPSLFNILADFGFNSAYECENPAMPGMFQDWTTTLAIKGEAVRLLSRPHDNELAQGWRHTEVPQGVEFRQQYEDAGLRQELAQVERELEKARERTRAQSERNSRLAARLGQARERARAQSQCNSQLIAQYSGRRYRLADTLAEGALRMPLVGKLMRRKAAPPTG